MKFITNILDKLKTPEALTISLSLLITTSLSVLCGMVGVFLNWGFWLPFLVAFVGQFVLGAAINSFLIYKNFLLEREVQSKEIEALSKITTRLNCAYCKVPNTVTLILNERNTFVCEACNQTNLILLSLSTSQITTPITKLKASKIKNEDKIQSKQP